MLTGGSVMFCNLEYASDINAKRLRIPSFHDFERLYLLKHLCHINKRLDIPTLEFELDL